jgi:hypothetical protein
MCLYAGSMRVLREGMYAAFASMRVPKRGMYFGVDLTRALKVRGYAAFASMKVLRVLRVLRRGTDSAVANAWKDEDQEGPEYL